MKVVQLFDFVHSGHQFIESFIYDTREGRQTIRFCSLRSPIYWKFHMCHSNIYFIPFISNSTKTSEITKIILRFLKIQYIWPLICSKLIINIFIKKHKDHFRHFVCLFFYRIWYKLNNNLDHIYKTFKKRKTLINKIEYFDELYI